MPDFWEFPTVSMGLGPINAIYQARFNRYLHNRGIKDTSQQRVWAFLGDGEMDEPESLGAIGLAAREELDNLTFVINCNLQRLDGPVRGNGKIIQELESFFRGAGWNVIKVIWGREWDELLAKDTDGALVNLMNTTPDGDYQTYKAEDGAYVREHFFGRDPRTRKMVEHLSDKEIWGLSRGGHDYRKMYAAYKAATEHTGQPTVILAKTIKGWTLGLALRGPQLDPPDEEAEEGRPDRLPRPALPRHPGRGAGRDPAAVLPPRQGLRRRWTTCTSAGSRSAATCRSGGRPRAPLVLPGDPVYDVMKRGSGKQKVATTMAFVRLLKELMKDKEIGWRFVPIIPDEARTFGMDSLFPTAKIYSPHGQNYTVGRPRAGAVLQGGQGGRHPARGHQRGRVDGVLDGGRLVVRHARHPDDPDLHLLLDVRVPADRRRASGRPVDQMVRGFVLGATAGRTTLNGEGLQHEDGHSLLLASTNPACVSYDPAFAFEVGAHRQGRAAPDVRRRRRRRSSTTSRSTTSPTPSRPSPRTSTSRASCAASTATPPPPRATGPRRSSWRPASRCSGRWRRSGCCRTTGTCRPTSGR